MADLTVLGIVTVSFQFFSNLDFLGIIVLHYARSDYFSSVWE